jgi:hypothetical protein
MDKMQQKLQSVGYRVLMQAERERRYVGGMVVVLARLRQSDDTTHSAASFHAISGRSQIGTPAQPRFCPFALSNHFCGEHGLAGALARTWNGTVPQIRPL